MSKFKFSVGDRVIISNDGQIYDTFWPMRKAWDFDCGDNDLGSFVARNNDMGTIVRHGYHYTSGVQIYGLQMDDAAETQIIISESGIMKAPDDQLEALIDRLSKQSDVFSIDTIREEANKIRNQYPTL